MSNHLPARRSLLTSMVLLASVGSANVFAGGLFDSGPQSVGEHATFQHETFNHADFNHSDFQASVVSFNTDTSFSQQGQSTFSQDSVTRFDNGIDSLSTSDDPNSQRFSQEEQQRLPNMRMNFENESFQHLNFN